MTTAPAPAALRCAIWAHRRRLRALGQDSSRDRIAHVTARARRASAFAFEFIFDFDAAELDDATIRQHFVAGGPPMKRQASLTLKHLQAWRLACARGARRIMVFEDDVVLHPEFHARLAAAHAAPPTGWRRAGTILLGGADAKVPDAFFLHPGPLVPLASTDGRGLRLTTSRPAAGASPGARPTGSTCTADQLIAHVDRAERSPSTGRRNRWSSRAA